jgi:hypothetical protein
MTVRDLIAQLEEMPPDYPIFINAGDQNYYHPLTLATLVELSDADPNPSHVALLTPKGCETFQLWHAGIRLPKKIEGN